MAPGCLHCFRRLALHPTKPQHKKWRSMAQLNSFQLLWNTTLPLHSNDSKPQDKARVRRWVLHDTSWAKSLTAAPLLCGWKHFAWRLSTETYLPCHAMSIVKTPPALQSEGEMDESWIHVQYPLDLICLISRLWMQRMVQLLEFKQDGYCKVCSRCRTEIESLAQFCVASLTEETSRLREACSLETSKANTCERSTLLHWLISRSTSMM